RGASSRPAAEGLAGPAPRPRRGRLLGGWLGEARGRDRTWTYERAPLDRVRRCLRRDGVWDHAALAHPARRSSHRRPQDPLCSPSAEGGAAPTGGRNRRRGAPRCSVRGRRPAPRGLPVCRDALLGPAPHHFLMRQLLRIVVRRRRVRGWLRWRMRRVRELSVRDRVGISWRPMLAIGIVAHLEQIDVVELIAEDFSGARRREMRALRTLAAQVPVVLHGISLGLASASPVPARLLERMARLVDDLRPESWSEHLAFVRADGVEIGHLAAPPRTEATIEGACRNLERARAVVGLRPRLENVATLIDPPGSALDEPSWISRIVADS